MWRLAKALRCSCRAVLYVMGADGNDGRERGWGWERGVGTGVMSRSMRVVAADSDGSKSASGRSSLWGDHDAGFAEVALAAVWAQGDVDAGAFKDAFGQGLFRFGLGRRDVECLPDGGQCGFAFGGREPTVVAHFLKASGQDVVAEAFGELPGLELTGLDLVVVITVAPGVGHHAVFKR